MRKDKNRIVYFRIFSKLTGRKKKQFFILIAVILFVAALETLTLASIALFATSLSNPESLQQNKYFLEVTKVVNGGNWTQKDLIIFLSLTVAILVLLKNIFMAISRYGFARYSASVESLFGMRLLEGFIEMPYIWHVSQNSADLIQAIQWRRYFGEFIHHSMLALSDILIVSFMLIAISIYKPAVSIPIVIIIGSISILIYHFIRKVLDKKAQEVKNLSREAFVNASSIIDGIKDIKIMGVSAHFFNYFKKRMEKLISSLGLKRTLVRLPIWILETAGFIILSLSVFTMLKLMHLSVELAFTMLSLIVVTAWRVMPGMNRILLSISNMRAAVPFVIRLLGYLEQIDTNADSIKTDTSLSDIDMHSDIVFDEIQYKYPGQTRNAIENTSFKIKKGELIGIIGQSGAGKSTLADLLTELLSRNGGVIRIDGEPLGERGSLRNSIGYVPQFPYFFEGSIAENIGIGIKEDSIDYEKIKKICELAVLDFIDELSDGLYTNIGERGSKLSGGQKQRVAIARALYKNPQILILDEATNSLDNETERKLNETILKLKNNGMTVIVISHQSSSLNICDRIIWLDQGRIVNSGSPSSLLKEYNKSEQDQ